MHARWFAIFIFCLFIIGSSAAQDATQPLILLKERPDSALGEGDLWEWTGGSTLRQKTQWGYNEDLRLSPLNNEVAYESWARLWVEYIQDGMTSGGRFPGNIWVITTENSDLGTRIADQPAGAVANPQGNVMNTLIRGVPMWSPDGTQIAWVERAYPGLEPDRLVIYDKATRTTRTLVEELPMENGIDTGIEGLWIGDSIVILNRPIDGDPDFRFELAFVVYDATTGEQRFRVLASDFIERNDSRLPLIVPVEYQDKSWLGVLNTYPDAETFAEWHLIDVETGEVIVPESDTPAAVAAGHSDTSIRVQIHFASQGSDVFYTVMQQSDGRQLDLGLTEDQFVRSFALSPDGQAIAFQIYDRAADSYPNPVYVWRDGVVTEVPETDEPNFVSEFVWGATTWRIEFSALGQ